MAKGIKISDMSKDFAMKSKDIIEEFKNVNIEKTTGGTVSDEEFAVFMQHITSSHQISDLEAYRSGKITIKIAEKKAKAEPKAKEEPKAEPKVEKKAETKKDTAKKVEKEITEDSPEVKSAVAVKESKPAKNGKFDIQKAKDGRFFFSLYSSNGAVVAYSQIYSSLSAVNTGIASVITNASKAEIEDTTLKKPTSLPCPKWEIYIDKAEQYRFRLYATNGLCVCHSSHGYSSKSGCKGGIESIKKYAAEATVDKSYLK